jgi:hypothetical protein
VGAVIVELPLSHHVRHTGIGQNRSAYLHVKCIATSGE